MLSRENPKPIVEVVPYDGKLDTNVVLDWILDMDKFFGYEKTPNNKKVKIAVTRLKGHASLWWEHLQTGRQRRENERKGEDQNLAKDGEKGKEKISS